MHTKLLLFLFAGSILCTQCTHANDYNDQYPEYDRSRQKPKPHYTSQVWGEVEQDVSQRSSHTGKARSRSESDLFAAQSLNILQPTYQGLGERVTPLLPSTNSRTPIYDNFAGLLKPTNVYTNNGGAQLEHSANPNGQQPNVQPPNYQTIQSPGGQPVTNIQFNPNSGSYPIPIQSGGLADKSGASIQGSGQKEIKPERPDVTAKPQRLYPGASPLALSAMDSGLNVMRMLGGEKAGNTIISPISIWLTLAALQQGARSHSQNELAQFLLSDSVTSRQRASDLFSRSKKAQGGNIINIANGIFVDNSFTLNNDFKSISVNNFNAAVFSLNFNQAALAANNINNWVNKATNGHIPALVDQNNFDSSTQLLLTNALFFKGIWNTTFSKERTVPRVFGVRPGKDKNVLFMHQIGQFRAGVADNLDAKWLFLPFLNLEFNMLLLLPNEEFGLENMMASLTSRELNNIIRDQTVREVVMGIPKFKLSLETDLAEPLSQQIPSIFSPSADLTGLGASSNRESLYVSKVLHKVTMEINEEGSTAAAVTGLAVNTLSLASYNDEFRFTANHPFLVILFDKALSVPLFMARIVDP